MTCLWWTPAYGGQHMKWLKRSSLVISAAVDNTHRFALVMRVKGIPIKRKIDDEDDEGRKKQDIELTEFTKHNKLAVELRHHILTYSTTSTLASYSKCSKLCNSEIQRFNTEPPSEVIIIEKNDGALVTLVYRRGETEAKTVGKFFCFGIKNTLVEVQNFFLKYYKHVKEATFRVSVNVRRWPMELMLMKPIANAKEFRVHVSKSMYNDCMDYFKTQDLSNKELLLYDCEEVANQVTIPADFFKSLAFQNLKAADVMVKCEIENEDFIKLEKECVCLKTSVSFDDIRAKVNKWNRESHSKCRIVGIQLPEDDIRVFKFYDIFPLEQFDSIQLDVEEDNKDPDDLDRFQIGNVVVHIAGDDGIVLLLEFLEDS